MTIEIISRSISMKVWDQARIKLMTPGYAVELATDCAMGLSIFCGNILIKSDGKNTAYVNRMGFEDVTSFYTLDNCKQVL